MKILSLDTTAQVCSAAIVEDETLIAEMTVNTGNTHSQTLLPVIEQLLKISETRLDEIDCFACSTGPGSFTGVRIGVATLKGLAYGKNKPCVSVSTLEALAYNLIGYNGVICPVMNARRDQVYNALFECNGAELKRLCPDRAISVSELDAELCGVNKPIYLVGDGYDLTVNKLEQTRVGFVPEAERSQRGYSVACCARKRYEDGETLSDLEISPVYLRPSQAERERNERLAIKNNNT